MHLSLRLVVVYGLFGPSCRKGQSACEQTLTQLSPGSLGEAFW